MKYSRFITLGVVCFFLFLLVKFPAGLAYKMFVPEGIKMGGVQGTLWSGKAAAVVLNNNNIGSVNWDLSIWRLVTGKLAAEVELSRPDNGFANGHVALGFGQSVTLSDFRALINTAVLQIPALSSINADLGLNLDHAKLKAGWVNAIDGTVNIARLNVTQPRATLGNFQITFDDQDQLPITGQFSDADATLKASGNIVLTEERQYELNGTVTPTDQTEAAVKNAMRFLGSPAGDGSYPLRTAGSL